MNVQNECYFAWRALDEEWSETRQLWHDSAADRFETSFWEPLESETDRFRRELKQLMQTLEAAQSAAAER